MGNSDPGMWYRGVSFSGHVDIMGMTPPRGLVDVSFLGALELDV